MENFIVNIILPTFNRCEKACNTINIFRKQTVNNFLMIIVDDGSSKESYNKLADFVNKLQDQRFTLLRNETNKGVSATLNLALKSCSLKYTTWISDDNEYNNNFLELLLKAIRPDKEFAYGCHYIINEMTGKGKLVNREYNNATDLIKHFAGIVAFMWDTNFMKNIVGKYNEHLNGIEDFDFKIRTFINATKIGYTAECLVKFIRHKNCLYYKNKELVANRRVYITDIYMQFISKISKIIDVSNKIFIYISKTRYSIMFQRPHQLVKFLNKDKYFKIFVTSESVCRYEPKTNTWIINFDFFESIMYLLAKKQIIIYYSNPQLLDNVLKFKQQSNNVIVFDLIDNPVQEFKIWKVNLKSALLTANEIVYSHKYLKSVISKLVSKRATYINNGVDFPLFSKSAHRTFFLKRPKDLPATNKPIIGYYGSISTWLDYNLILKVANIQTIHVVMIGVLPNNKYIPQKYNHENITWLDHKPYCELPKYLSWFDACIIPFKLSEMIKGCDPIKFYEYCASGKPILTTIDVADAKNVHKINKNNVVKIIKNLQYTHNPHENQIISKINDWRSKADKLDELLEKNLQTDDNRFTVGLVGYINFGNYGDDLFKKIYKNVLDASVYKVVVLHDYNTAPYFEHIKKTLKTVDVVLICGGDIIMPYSLSKLYWLNEYLTKPVYIHNISVSQFDELTNKSGVNTEIVDHYKKFLRHPSIKCINVRDTESKVWIETNIVPNVEVNYYPDIVFTLNKQKNPVSSKHIGVCLRWRQKYNSKNLDSFNKVLREFKSSSQQKIKFIMTSVNEPSSTQDMKILDVFDAYDDVQYSYNINDITNFITRCSFIVTDRFHVCIVALLHNIPVMCLSNNRKFRTLFNIIGCPICIKDPATVTLADMLQAKNVKINTSKINSLREQAHEGIDELKLKLLKNVRVMHFGSYWQQDNDVVKLMLHDLRQVCTVTEVDTHIYDKKQSIVTKFTPYPKDYPNGCVRYIKNKIVKKIVDKVKPNIVITNSGGMTFTDFMFSYLKNKKIITIGISLSDPDVFAYNGRFYAHKYDYFFTNSLKSLKTEYKKTVNINLIPFACSTKLHKPSNNIDKEYDVVIVANSRPDRVQIVNRLRTKFNVGVFGNGWPNRFNASSVNGQQHVNALNSGKIYISFALTVAGEINVKVGLFEAAACKLVLMTDKNSEVLNYFEETKEIFLFNSAEDLIKKIQYLLDNPSILKEVAENSYSRFIRDHLWQHRWIQLFKKIL